MVKAFLDFINRNKLCKKSDKVLVAVSGGLDSVVLAHLFKESGFNFAMAHCNFQLREEESDADEAFVSALAKKLNTQCFLTSFDTTNYAALHQVSIQMAARDLRYTWFESIANENDFDHIATAHHLDDSFETALFNLAKGTGISGLRGILPKQGYLIRPMLFATKNEIMDYARLHSLVWREDSSNLSTKYSRNLIRHEVMPLLKKINPALESTFRHTQERLMATESVVRHQAEELAAKYAISKGQDVYVSLTGLKKGNVVLTEELLRPYGFNFFQVREIFDAVNTAGTIGKYFISDHYQVNIDRTNLIISPRIPRINEQLITARDKEIKNEVVQLKFSISANTDDLRTGKHEASLDFNRLKFPLKLRKWEIGDRFQPLGMKGKKKLSDFMIDEKIPLNLKERVCVLESDGEVVWVVGYRIDDRFKVKADTRKIFNIVISGNDKSI